MQGGRLFVGMLAAAVQGPLALGATGPVLRVELSSYRQLTADIASLSGHVQNPMLNMGLVAFGNLVGSPGLLGVDPERPMRWALYPEGDGWRKAEWVMVLPVTGDGQAFLDSLKVSYDVTQDDGRIRRFRASRPVQSFREMSVRLVEGLAVASPSEPLALRTAELLQTNAAALTPEGLSGTLRLAVDVAAALPMARLRFEESTRAADAVGEPPEGPSAAAEAMRRLYVDVLFRLLEQAAQVAFGLQCDAQGLTVYSRLDARPGTPLSNLCAEAAPPPARLLALLPPDASGVYAGGTLGAFMRHGMNPYLEFTAKMLDLQRRHRPGAGSAAGQQPGPDPAVLLERMRGAWQGYGDGMVLSFGPEGDGRRMVLFEALVLSDAGKVLETMAENLELANEIYAASGLPLRFERREDREVEGASVQVYGLELGLPEADAEVDPSVAAFREAWAAFQERFGDRAEWVRHLVMELAVVDEVLLLTVGGSGSLDPFLGRLRAAPAEVWSAHSRALFSEIRNHDRAVEFWLLKPLALARRLVPVFDKEGAAAKLLAELPDDGEGLGGLTLAAPTTAMGAFRIGASCLTALARSATTMQRLNPRGGGGRPSETPQGDPVEVVLPEE